MSITSIDQHRFDTLKVELAERLKRWSSESLAIGQCLAEVRDNEFYVLDGHERIEEWAEHKFGIRRSHTQRLVNYFEVFEDQTELEAPWVPGNERQARPLKKLASQERVSVAEFIATRYGGQATAEQVASAVAEVCPWRTGQTAKPEVMQKRAEQRMRTRVTNACQTLAEEEDARTFLQMFGPSPVLEKAWRYLNAMAVVEGWK